jgi:hypothetical protein
MFSFLTFEAKYDKQKYQRNFQLFFLFKTRVKTFTFNIFCKLFVLTSFLLPYEIFSSLGPRANARDAARYYNSLIFVPIKPNRGATMYKKVRNTALDTLKQCFNQ